MMEWISVKERLPEKEEENVIWAFSDGTMMIQPKWVIVGGATHWMPLPKPPED